MMSEAQFIRALEKHKTVMWESTSGHIRVIQQTDKLPRTWEFELGVMTRMVLYGTVLEWAK